MLLVFFLLFSILQRSLPSQVSHQTLKSVFSNWSHLASSLRRGFRLFLILGGEIWEGSAFETIRWSCRVLSQDFVLILILCFPRACISALGLMQHPWRTGFRALFTLPFSFAPERQEFYFSAWFWPLGPCHLLRNRSAFQLLISIWISCG